MTVEAFPRPADRYVVVTKDGTDVLHRNPGEQCNTDDAARKRVIPEVEALRLKLGGFVRLCQHCYPPIEEGGES